MLEFLFQGTPFTVKIRSRCFDSTIGSCLFAASTAHLIVLWGERSDPYLQALQFFGMVGSLLCVLAAKPFLSSRMSDQEDLVNLDNATTTANLPDSTEDSQLFVPLNCLWLVKNSTVTYYVIVGVVAVVGGLLHMVDTWRSGWNLSHLSGTRNQMNRDSRQESDFEPRYQSCMTIGLLCMLILFYSLSLETFVSFIISLQSIIWVGQQVMQQPWQQCSGAVLCYPGLLLLFCPTSYKPHHFWPHNVYCVWQVW